MPSEQRLHPASILFSFASSLKAFALPGLLVLLGTGRASSWRPSFGVPGVPDGFELWLMLLIIPSSIMALARYLSFRLRYDDTELVIRSGILFRKERHVPYDRIQNLDAVQNVFHRALGVVEVQLETGASKEPEATISVLPASAVADMRRRVFAGRRPAAAPAPEVEGAAPAADTRVVLRLPVRELLLHGFLENRGFVIIAALYGLAWETGVLGPLWDRFFDEEAYGPGMVRGVARSIAEGNRLGAPQVALLGMGITLLLLVVRLVSMAWAVVRLYDFTLTRAGEDLRSDFGLLTRVSSTIPLRRVQTVTIRQGPLHRLVSRLSVRVETAGGGTEGPGRSSKEREWLAPILRPADLPRVVADVLPGFDPAALDWQRPHDRAFRRAVKPAVALSLVLTAGSAALLSWAALAVLPLAVGWAVFATRRQIDRLAWAATDELVAFRSGWLWRSLTVARIGRIQAVARMETPFDRRTAMARVRVDTAGAGERSHRIDIPYLARATAAELHARLAAGAARTAFRW